METVVIDSFFIERSEFCTALKFVCFMLVVYNPKRRKDRKSNKARELSKRKALRAVE